MKYLIPILTVMLFFSVTIAGDVTDVAYPKGMGAAYTAISDGGTSFFYNPAGASTVKGYLFSIGYQNLFFNLSEDNLNSGFFGVILPWKRCVREGAALRMSTGLGFDYFNSDIYSKMTFSPVVAVSFLNHEDFFGRVKKRVHLGFRGRFYREQFNSDYARDPFDPLLSGREHWRSFLDAGAMLTFEHARFGLSARNLLASSLSDSSNVFPPLDVRLGMAFDISSLLLSAEVGYSDGEYTPHLGLNWSLQNGFDLMCGLNSKHWATMGLGFRIMNSRFGYSIEIPLIDAPEELTNHRVSLEYCLPRYDYPDISVKLDPTIAEFRCGEPPDFVDITGTVEKGCCRIYNPGFVYLGLYTADPRRSTPVANMEIPIDSLNEGRYRFAFNGVPYDLIEKKAAYIGVDYTNRVYEKKLKNNYVPVPVKQIDHCIDLTVSSVDRGEEPLIIDRGVTIDVDIFSTNEYPIDTTLSLLVLSDRGDTLADTTFSGSLLLGGSNKVTIYFLPDSSFLDVDTLFFVIDAGEVIPESNEGNNLFSLPVLFQRPLGELSITQKPVVYNATLSEEPLIPVVYFAPRVDSLILSDEYNIEDLDRLGERLAANDRIKVTLYGYSDILSDADCFNFDTVSFKDNPARWRANVPRMKKRILSVEKHRLKNLARMRAKSVKRYLVKNFSIEPARVFLATGYNEFAGINNNLRPDPISWFENRRVEIRTDESSRSELYAPEYLIDGTEPADSLYYLDIRGDGIIGGRLDVLVLSEFGDTITILASGVKVTSSPQRIFWDGRGLELGKQYRIKAILRNDQQVKTVEVPLDFFARESVYFVALFNFGEPTKKRSSSDVLAFFNPDLEYAKQAVRTAIREAKEKGIDITLQSYASYLDGTAGEFDNIKLAERRASFVRRMFSLRKDEIATVICGDVCERKGSGCDPIWCSNEQLQRTHPKNRVLLRATILKIEY